MNEFREFFYMGGFAFYVWSAYSLAVIVLALNAVLPWFCRRHALSALNAEDE